MQKNKVNILIVDDSEFSRRAMAQILTQAGHTVVGAVGSAKEALGVLSIQTCHLVLLDIVMPDVNGLEFAEQIHEKFKSTSVIIVSSLSQEHIVIESIASGAVDFIQKPFNPEFLVESVERVIKQISFESTL